ncbi:hypothetical protein BD413DRAFT_513651 [Trametes elegans]|nr:hypothetical protein BD413DRAFT_513651 [Trametes elegans]
MAGRPCFDLNQSAFACRLCYGSDSTSHTPWLACAVASARASVLSVAGPHQTTRCSGSLLASGASPRRVSVAGPLALNVHVRDALAVIRTSVSPDRTMRRRRRHRLKPQAYRSLSIIELSDSDSPELEVPSTLNASASTTRACSSNSRPAAIAQPIIDLTAEDEEIGVQQVRTTHAHTAPSTRQKGSGHGALILPAQIDRNIRPRRRSQRQPLDDPHDRPPRWLKAALGNLRQAHADIVCIVLPNTSKDGWDILCQRCPSETVSSCFQPLRCQLTVTRAAHRWFQLARDTR